MVKRKVGVQDPEDVKRYMPAFIKWAYTEGFPGWTWADYVDRWLTDASATKTSYEALNKDTNLELTRILTQIGVCADERTVQNAVDKFSFAAQSGRKPGDRDNEAFVRKGVVGDWKNCFNREAALLFSELAGDQLIAAGYEKDNSWVYHIE